MKRISIADFVLVFHFLFSAFAVLGGFLVPLDWRVSFVHIPAVVWSSVVNLMKWTCPLTPLEKRLRQRAGQQAFEGSWIQHYVEPLVRPLGMPRRMELVAGLSVLVWNAIVYGIILWGWDWDGSAAVFSMHRAEADTCCAWSMPFEDSGPQTDTPDPSGFIESFLQHSRDGLIRRRTKWC